MGRPDVNSLVLSLHREAGGDPEPQCCADDGNSRADIQGILPSQVRCQDRSKGRGNEAAQIAPQVHHASGGATPRSGKFHHGGPKGTFNAEHQRRVEGEARRWKPKATATPPAWSHSRYSSPA